MQLRTSESLAIDVLAALEICIFAEQAGGSFRLASRAPQWLEHLLPEDADTSALDLTDIFPFLESFLAGAWPPSCLAQSDLWTQRDRRGQDRHLRATALIADGRSLLVLESPAGEHQARSQSQQRANESVLAAERIERMRRELARLNDELKARNLEVERATRAKSDFLAAMSHEIRTPMNAIIGMAELLSRTPLTAEQQKYVEVFQGAGENLLALINDILDLAKVEAGKVELEPAAFDLAGVLAKAIAIIRPRAEKKGLTVRHRVAAGVPPRLIGDAGRLQQILINLLGNSIKFTEKGGLDVTVEPDPQSMEAGRLRFAVADTGIGIPAEKLDTIFEDFTQVDRSTTRKYGGTGLGLSISRQLVALMQGRIWVESTPGVGSTFYFTATFGVATDSMPAPQPAVERRADFQLAPGLRILLADDSEDNRFLILSYLKDTGCSVDVAEHGAQAVEMFSTGKYDLVLMDVEMPEMDGYTAARTIRKREQGKPVPILALTAHAFAEAVNRSIEAGFTAHLTKPIRRSTLLEAIATHAPTPRDEAQARRPRVTVEPSLQDLIPAFLEKRRRDAPKLAAALAAGDFESLKRFGHNLKGTGAGYGFPALSEIGGAIEAGATARNGPAIQGKLEELVRYLEQVEWSAASDVTEN